MSEQLVDENIYGKESPAAHLWARKEIVAVNVLVESSDLWHKDGEYSNIREVYTSLKQASFFLPLLRLWIWSAYATEACDLIHFFVSFISSLERF